MTTTTTSGAADLRTAAQAVVDRWDTPPWKDVPATAEYIGRLRAALAAGQATVAQQPGAAYAALPEYGINTASHAHFRVLGFTADQMRAFADATHTLRASHGQASSQAGEYPALVCDYCGALTPDPWHSSGMLHGKMSKHIHSCDACASHGQAPAGAAHEADSAPAVGYPPLPNLDGSNEQIWEAIFNWKTATPGADAVRKANKVENAIIGTMRACVDADRAARAPADSVQEDAARLDYLHSTGSTIEMLPGEGEFYPMRFRVGGLHSAVSPNLREAIDAARKQGEKQ